MAAHARATAVQELPALPLYTGEGKRAADDGFERWIERFKERAKVAGWNTEHQLYQLKVHLDQTASDVFRMIPETECDTFKKGVAALGKGCIQSVDWTSGLTNFHIKHAGMLPKVPQQLIVSSITLVLDLRGGWKEVIKSHVQALIS